MQKSVLDYLDNPAHADRIAYESASAQLSFSQLRDTSMRIGSFLLPYTNANEPVVVLSHKNTMTPALFLGVVQAGCCYVPIDASLPEARIEKIMSIVNAKVVVTDDQAIAPPCLHVLPYHECATAAIDITGLAVRRNAQNECDPLCVIFTSGSSGTPKGVVLPHRAVIDYIDSFCDAFAINGSDVIGSQAPLDYVAALRDIYIPLKTGAKTVLLSKSLFSTPKLLMDTVVQHQCTLLPWVASALSLCATLRVFDEVVPGCVNKVFFTGSVLPSSHLRYWQLAMPDTLFVNHYGPTEITASCTYYIVPHLVAETDVLPIGKPFKHARVTVLNEQGRIAAVHERGELCVSGSGLALGYWGDADATARSFTQCNNDALPGRVYHTGDIGSVGADGLLYFHGRRDFQIKHMGHRIEPADIELAGLSVDGVNRCGCLYDDTKNQLVLCYTGTATVQLLASQLRQLLPSHMIPRRFVLLESLPLNTGGKLDYTALKAQVL